MTESQWVDLIAKTLHTQRLHDDGKSLQIKTGLKLAYAYEIATYRSTPEGTRANAKKLSSFETDLAIVEVLDGGWKPRVVLEAKLSRVTTHDAITYSNKAGLHRAVHPYLRYGIMLGNRNDYPLPGRLFRHGAQFDFMISFKAVEPTSKELRALVHILREEIRASITLEEMLYEARKPGRVRHTVLQRKLITEEEIGS
jgi:hypothetical protein